MRPFAAAPTRVRAAAIGLAVLAHLLVVFLLAVERRIQRSDVNAGQPRLVSLSLLPEPPPQPPPKQPARAVRDIAPVVAPTRPVATPAPAVVQPAAPVTPAPEVAPPPSWNSAAQNVADLYMANHDPPDYAGALIGPSALRKPCKPPEINKEMQAKIDELLDRHPDPRPPVTSPPGSVMMNGQRVGVLTLPRKIGKSEHIIPPEELLDERKSSVPDPFTCD